MCGSTLLSAAPVVATAPKPKPKATTTEISVVTPEHRYPLVAAKDLKVGEIVALYLKSTRSNDRTTAVVSNDVENLRIVTKYEVVDSNGRRTNRRDDDDPLYIRYPQGTEIKFVDGKYTITLPELPASVTPENLPGSALNPGEVVFFSAFRDAQTATPVDLRFVGSDDITDLAGRKRGSRKDNLDVYQRFPVGTKIILEIKEVAE